MANNNGTGIGRENGSQARGLWQDSSGLPLEQRVRKVIKHYRENKQRTVTAVYVPTKELAEETTIDGVRVIPDQYVGQYTMQIEWEVRA